MLLKDGTKRSRMSIIIMKIKEDKFNSIQFNLFKEKNQYIYSNKTHTEHVRFFGPPREAKLVSAGPKLTTKGQYSITQWALP